MTEDHMDAPPRCTATAKGTGERCKRRPIPGGTVCVKHGGGAPAVRAAADERLAQAEAESVVRKLWVGLENAAPVTDPVASLQRLAGGLEEMANVLGNRVNEMQSIEAGSDLAQVRGHAAALDKVIGHLRGLLADMVRLGIAQQRLQLERDQARMVGVAAVDGLDAIVAFLVAVLEPFPGPARDAVLAALPELREVFTAAFLGRLRLAELGDGGQVAS